MVVIVVDLSPLVRRMFNPHLTIALEMPHPNLVATTESSLHLHLKFYKCTQKTMIKTV